MVPFLRLMPAALSDKYVRSFLRGHQVQMELPFRAFSWHMFINQAKHFFGPNFMPFMLFLSGGVGAFHYEKILALIGKDFSFIYPPGTPMTYMYDKI
jgi:hypothetical protein